ncbi:MAG: ATP-grasp domain-containing protein [Candidatus Omnitrophota bacterium]
MRILITALGGDLGQSLAKTARLSRTSWKVFGSDCRRSGIGRCFVDAFFCLPPASDRKAYEKALVRLCQKEKIAAVIPASEIEIRTLAESFEDRILPGGAKVIVQPFVWLSVYGDKLRCMQSLLGKVALAAYADGGDLKAVKHLAEHVGFPLVVKPRLLSGSRSVQIARTPAELELYLAKTDRPLVQEYLEGVDGEFSVGVYRACTFTTLIAFRRDLGPVGCSWFAETDPDPEVLDYSEKLVSATGLKGAANFQIRKTSKGARLLEINPRFSSLVMARALCGFKDLEWALAEAFGKAVRLPRAPYKKLRFQRFFHEMVDDGQGYRSPFGFSKRGALRLL